MTLLKATFVLAHRVILVGEVDEAREIVRGLKDQPRGVKADKHNDGEDETEETNKSESVTGNDVPTAVRFQAGVESVAWMEPEECSDSWVLMTEMGLEKPKWT